MKHASLIILVVLIAVTSFAQPPEANILWTTDHYSPSASFDVVKTGGYIVVIYQTIYRLDESGNVLWTNESSGERYHDVLAVSDGGYLVCGRVNSDIYVAKRDEDGDLVWEFVQESSGDGTFAQSAELPDGSFVCMQRDYNYTEIFRFSSNGDLLEIRDLAYSGYDMEVVSDGILIAGHEGDPYWGEQNYRLQKIGFQAGRGFLFPIYGPSSDSSCRCVIELSNGLILALGTYPVIGPVLVVHGPRTGTDHLVRRWPYENWFAADLLKSADNKLLVLSSINDYDPGYRISKVNMDLSVHWSVERDDRNIPAMAVANDGGLVLFAISFTQHDLVKFEPEASVSLETDTQIVPPGASTIHINTTVDNILLDNTDLDLWTVLYPPIGDPIVSDVLTGVTLVPGETLAHEDSLVVLAGYPAGEYMCRVHVGDFDNKVTMGASTFEFEKLASTTTLTAADSRNLLPDDCTLVAHPNPFNAFATLTLTVPKAQNVCVEVYATTGQRVTTLHDGPLAAGVNTLTFNGTGLASGVYLVRAETEGATLHRKLVLVR